MGDIEKLEFETTNFEVTDNATKNILGNMDSEILKEFNRINSESENDDIENESENKGLNMVPEEDVISQGKGRKRKYKQETWDEYAEKKAQEFEQIALKDSMNSTIVINNIPNEEEFQEIITTLKDHHGGRTTEFIITSCGFGRFYHIYISTGLKDVISVIKQVNRSFYSENMEQFKIGLTESILDKNKKEEARFVLHMSKQQKAIIRRLLQDIKISESSFGFVCCIATFNKAKEKFEQFLTEKYEVLYEDDGYFKLIKKEIDRATVNGISWVINSMPIMLVDVEKHKQQYLYDIDNPKLEKKLIMKINVMDEAMKVVGSKNMEIPTKYGLDFNLHKEEVKLKQQLPI